MKRSRKQVLPIGARQSEPPSDDCLVATKQVCQMLGNCSKMHVWRLLNDKSYRSLAFPRPITIGKVGRHERKYFRLGEIRAWLAKRAVAVQMRAA